MTTRRPCKHATKAAPVCEWCTRRRAYAAAYYRRHHAEELERRNARRRDPAVAERARAYAKEYRSRPEVHWR